ncbi:hypothetical protein ACFXKF_16980 [Streptomyces scopuliridis]|uniref:hypothetical protein n=1 Tax=Streptomyces scopuliridis TaxID=452529 RepID=UPI00367FA956
MVLLAPDPATVPLAVAGMAVLAAEREVGDRFDVAVRGLRNGLRTAVGATRAYRGGWS